MTVTKNLFDCHISESFLFFVSFSCNVQFQAHFSPDFEKQWLVRKSVFGEVSDLHLFCLATVLLCSSLMHPSNPIKKSIFHPDPVITNSLEVSLKPKLECLMLCYGTQNS